MNLLKKQKKKELKKLFGNKQLNTKFKVGDIIVIKRIGLLTYKKNKQTIIGICIKKTLKTNSLNSSFVLRYIDANVVVDQRFPLYSPFLLEIKKIDKLKSIRLRSNLYYLQNHKLFDIKKLKQLNKK